jgi:hypothetical protein
MEYGNAAQFLTEFQVPMGLPLWIGRVHPGNPRAVLGKLSGMQVLVERRYLAMVRETNTTILISDLGDSHVYSGRPPSVDS